MRYLVCEVDDGEEQSGRVLTSTTAGGAASEYVREYAVPPTGSFVLRVWAIPDAEPETFDARAHTVAEVRPWRRPACPCEILQRRTDNLFAADPSCLKHGVPPPPGDFVVQFRNGGYLPPGENPAGSVHASLARGFATREAAGDMASRYSVAGGMAVPRPSAAPPAVCSHPSVEPHRVPGFVWCPACNVAFPAPPPAEVVPQCTCNTGLFGSLDRPHQRHCACFAPSKG